MGRTAPGRAALARVPSRVRPPGGRWRWRRLDRELAPRRLTADGAATPTAGAAGAAYRCECQPPGEPRGEGARPARAMQIHNRYLVTESDEGVMVIDQHALHERILYEQLRARIEAGPIETQSLLVPEPVDLAPAEAAAALEHRDLLAGWA